MMPIFFPPLQTTSWFIVFQMKSYISSAPLLPSDELKKRGDQKKGDRERGSGSFSSLFSPHSANVHFFLTA